MKAFIYNVLSKGLLILLLLAVVAGYYYRAELFPQYFGPSVSQADAVPTASGSSAGTAPETTAVPLPAPPMAGVEPVFASAEQDGSEAADAAAPQWPEATPVGAGADAARTQAQMDDDSPADDPLLRARRAYWAGDLDGAVTAYQQAAAARPDDPDVQGELGNIFFAQGNWKGASAAYLAAGRALLDRGDRAAAGHLVAVLEGLNPEQARTLADALMQQPDSGRP